MDYGLIVVYQVYARSTRDLANSLKHNSLSPAWGPIVSLNLLMYSIELPFHPSYRLNFGDS